MKKKAVLAVSFGTSYIRAIRDCIEPAEAAIRRGLPDYDLYRAFTSGMIIRKLKKEGQLIVQTPEEALNGLAAAGYEVIAVQPTHILAGIEYSDLAAVTKRFAEEHPKIQVVLGQPLLFENRDYERAAKALGQWMPVVGEHEAVILMGHGTEHVSNSSYFQLQYYLDRQPGRAVYVNRKPLHGDAKTLRGQASGDADGGGFAGGAYLANVEAPPVLEDVIERLHREGVTKVYLMPFMLVAGDHAHNDMAGENADSFYSRLTAAGISVDVIMRGIGESKELCGLYEEKARKLIQNIA